MLETNQTRPSTVRKALQISYAVLILGIILSIIELPKIVEDTISTSGGAKLSYMNVVVIFAFIQMLSVGVVWLLIFLIGRRKNWARYLLVILYILSIPLSLPLLIEIMADEPIKGLLGFVQIILQLLALVLLFRAPSREWFKKPSY